MSALLYIHGLNSSPASQKARQLTTLMQHLGLAQHLRIPELHHHPQQAIQQLQAAIAELGEPVLIGSSLGGYYATWLAERYRLKALLINPAVAPYRLFDGQLTTQTNHYSGETWEPTLDHIQALKDLEVPAPVDGSRYQIWLQTADEVLDYRDAQHYYRHCKLHIEDGGDHSFQGFAKRLPDLLRFAGVPSAHWHNLDFSLFDHD